MSSQQTSDQARPVERVRPPEAADERATLSGMLDFLQDTVVYKVAGLTDEQALPGRRLPGRVRPLTPDQRGSLLRRPGRRMTGTRLREDLLALQNSGSL